MKEAMFSDNPNESTKMASPQVNVKTLSCEVGTWDSLLESQNIQEGNQADH